MPKTKNSLNKKAAQGASKKNSGHRIRNLSLLLACLTAVFGLSSLTGCSVFGELKDIADSIHGGGGDASSSEGKHSSENSASQKGSSESISSSGDVITSAQENCDPITFHFIDREEQYSGDSVYIKVGDKDILIDAGARKGSASAIETYLEDSSRSEYVSDNKLEYVVTTHAHQDHIAGMMGAGKAGILYRYQVDNLIDFSYLDAQDGKHVINNADPSNSAGSSSFVDYEGTDAKSSSSSSNTTDLYKDYVTARNVAISKGTNWKTVGELCNFSNRSYSITLGKGVTMTLLYSFFYDHTSADVTSLESSYTRTGFSDQNDYSICLLFTQGSRNFLFTGDAESYAEHSLVKYNSLPNVDLFKAGHHGSYTASSAELLDAVDPDLCVVTCCAGNMEYASDSNHSFPAQEFVDRIAKHTDRVYVTTLGRWGKEKEDKAYYEPFNGHVVVNYDEKSKESLSCSNNSIKLKDSEWFKANRTMPDEWKS